MDQQPCDECGHLQTDEESVAYLESAEHPDDLDVWECAECGHFNTALG